MSNIILIPENSIYNGDIYDSPVVTSDHFGVNTLLNTVDMLFPSVIEAMTNTGMLTMRYPGGTVAETLVDVVPYGEDHVVEPTITDQGNEIVTVAQFMDVARQVSELGGFIPTITFVVPTSGAYSGERPAAGSLRDGDFDEMRPIEDGYVEDVVGYVRFAIEQAAANGVQIGQLEIGNEFFCPDGANMNGREYGNIAGRIIFALDQMMNSAEVQPLLSGARPEITIQSVHHSCGDYYRDSDWANINVLQGLVEAEAAQGQSLLQYIDGITSHYHFEDSFDIVDTAGQAALTTIPGFWSGTDNLSRVVAYDNSGDASDITWVITEDQANAARNLYSDFFTRFYEGYQTPDDRPLSFDVTEWSVQHPSGTGYYGLSQAAMMAELFYEMATHGVTTASFWRMMNINRQWVGGGLIDRSDLLATGEVQLSVPGAMFDLMSESLIGLRAKFDFEYNGSQSTGDDGTLLDIHGFTHENYTSGEIDKLVMFVSNRSDANSDATQLDISGIVGSSDWYFVVNTILGDGDSDGRTMNAEPEIVFGNGSMATDPVIDTYEMDGWGMQRIEISIVNDGDNIVKGRIGNDTILGLGGNDTLIGGGGNDSLKGQNGNDLLIGEDGADTIVGGWGHDTIYAGSEDDIVYGGGDNDIIGGGQGWDILFGDEGDDVIWGASGNDLIDGGLGNDLICGGDDDDIVFAHGGNDTTWGGLGNDTIDGGLGNDLIGGGIGNDSIRGFDNDDTIWGGAGSDTIDGGTGQDLIGAGEGDDVVFGGDGNDVIWAGNGRNVILGNEGDDLITGGRDSDQIWGEDGNDTLFAGAGDDYIGGGAGDDSIFGGDGADVFWGGAGNDYLDAGAGNDTFVFVDGFGNDTIAGFSSGADRDVIDLRDVTSVSTYADLLNGNMYDTDQGVVITTAGAGGDSILLLGVSLSSISEADFIL